MVAHWTFDEGSGTQVVDTISGLNGTLSLTGATWESGGKVGGAINLSKAANGWVTMGDVLNLGTGPYSFVVWVRTSTTDSSTAVLSKHWAGFPNGYFIGINYSGSYGASEKAWFYNYYNGLEPISTTSVNNGQWHQIVGVRGNGVVKIYIDGLPEGILQPDQGLTDSPPGTPFLVGGYSVGGNPLATYTGLIDDIQVYTHMLTDQEVQWLYDHPGQTLSCTPPPAGLVSWWKAENNFDDAYGGNNGTGQNGTTFAAGKVGQAFRFDGVDDYVEVGPAANSINSIAGDISITAWIKTDSVSDYYKMIAATREGDGEEKGWEFLAEKSNVGGKLTFQIDNGPTTDYRIGTSNIRDGQWHLVVGIRSGTNLYVYVDGVLENGETQGGVGGMISSTAATFIGKTPSANDNDNARWEGLMDEVAIYNRALSAEEIAAIYAAGSMGKCRLPGDIAGLRLWLMADSGVILSGTDSVATWEDRSGNGLDVAQAAEGNRPARVAADLNGMPVVRFDGVNDYLIREAVPGSDLFNNNADTVFIVQKQSGAKNETTTFSWASDGFNRFMVHATMRDVIYYQVGSNAGGGDMLAAPQPYGWDDRWHLLKLKRDGVGPAGLVAVDGIGLTPTINNFSPGNNLPAADFYVGSDRLSFNWFQGDMAEILVFNRALTAQEQQTIEGYLRSKYGFTNTPNSFAFIDKTGQPFDTVIESDPITVTGITLLAPISISAGGEYAVNADPPLATPGIVKNGDLVRVYVRSSDTPATTTEATLTIGGISDTFSVTTRGLLFLPLILKN